jgi:hypothetical protein
LKYNPIEFNRTEYPISNRKAFVLY